MRHDGPHVLLNLYVKAEGYWESGLKNILEEAEHKSRTMRQTLLGGQRPEWRRSFSDLKEN